MKTPARRPWLLLASTLTGLVVGLAARPATAQTYQSEAAIVEGERVRFKSPQRFAFELRFGPFRPDVDSEFDGARTPYKDFYGEDRHLLTQIEVDYEFFHRFGTLAVGAGFGYFNVSGKSPVAGGTGQPSGDTSTLKVYPFSLSLVYRFDYFLEQRRFPLVPFGKAGFNYSYWQITDGNDEIANDGQGGEGRGGTPGWHVAAGFALVLDTFDPESARDFDSDLGVNHTAIVVQYTYADVSGLGAANHLHVGDRTWSVGLLLQF